VTAGSRFYFPSGDRFHEGYVDRKRSIAGPKVVRAVMQRIEGGRLRPGERIVPKEIALKLGTSNIPVREAFYQLVGREILVERYGDGFFAATITSATLRALYAAHGQVIETLLHRWHTGVRLTGRFSNPWRLFDAIAARADDDALAGVQRYLAGRLALARKHEAVYVASDTATRELAAALRAGDAATALETSRTFHQACDAAAFRIWQLMSDR
jgi:DNA-binding GntR family transcriptional regulator